MTVDEIRTRIAALEQARHELLLGRRRERVGYQSGNVQFASVKAEDLSMEIARLKADLAALTGEASGLAPYRPAFGERP